MSMEVVSFQDSHSFSDYLQINHGTDELQTIKQKLEFDLQNLTIVLKEQAENSIFNLQRLAKSNKHQIEKIDELQRENDKLRSDNSLLTVKLQAAEHLLNKTNQEYCKYESESKTMTEKISKSKEKTKKLKDVNLQHESSLQEVIHLLTVLI
jgi:chromosome segregation ATPase